MTIGECLWLTDEDLELSAVIFGNECSCVLLNYVVKRTLILARMSANAVQPRVVALHVINKIERANTQVSIGERLSRADSSLRECLKNKKQTEAMHLREEVINVKLSVSSIFRTVCIFSETLFRR